FGSRGLNILSRQWQEPIPVFSAYAAVSNWPVFVFDMRKPSVPFYLHRRVILTAGKEDLESGLKALPHAYIMTPAANEEYFRHLRGSKIVFRRGRFLLVAYEQKLY